MPHSVSPAAEEGSTPLSATQMDQDSPAAAGSQPGQPAEEDTVMADASGDEAEVEAVKSSTDLPEARNEKQEIKAEDLFNDIDSDDDDEFPTSSNPAKGDMPTSTEPQSSPGDVDYGAGNKELMRIFYQRFFPWRYMFHWLNHSPTPTNDFKHREFSLWTGDIVFRYQSYNDYESFRKDIIQRLPDRVEIGPVYTANPRDRKVFRNSTAFRPLAKELCFDIDLTDYDDIRTCCDKANICIKCWQFMTMAIKVLDTALREDFGFQHILWVYSGRRGVHAWVCDKKARELDDQQRKAITGYFDVIRGPKESGKRVNLRRPLHPHLSRSLDLLKTHFQSDVLEVQDPWRSPEKADYLLQLIPDPDLREALRKKWESSPGSASSRKWADIDALAQTGSASKTLDARDLLDAKQDIVLEHTYPRLDVAVSQHLNHLLKSPFVVHPGTGRVCVPIDRDALEEFDPLGVPTAQGLLREIDAWNDGSTGEGQQEDGGGAVKHVQDWEKTSLKPYIDYFRSFVTALMKDEREIKVKRERDEEQAESLDF
ncbi:prim-pol domain-containing protein [Canariomyces notabilis]|uniref:DNA primase n=1 Tax=Canariomyces notabilis TaxID=2074819 RepID=A0AAN6TBX6_9PEZI|nr:prim-pol domain-containing protein [Canariomyces arenarius]